MSEFMVERVARAICRCEGFTHPDEDWRFETNGTVNLVFLEVEIEPGRTQRWRTYERHARAAIAAMREPTEAMLNNAGGFTPSRARDADAWRCFIDEALK